MKFSVQTLRSASKKIHEAQLHASQQGAAFVASHANGATKFAMLLTGIAVAATHTAYAGDASLKDTTTSIFLYIYGVVGVLGALAVTVCGINIMAGNFLSREDPKKTFFFTLLGTGIALGSVAIIQWFKTIVSTTGADITSL